MSATTAITTAATPMAAATAVPATVQTLWISNSGRVVCAAHGGHALKAAIAASPRARKHTTSLDAWQRTTLATSHPDEAAAAWMACATCDTRLT